MQKKGRKKGIQVAFIQKRPADVEASYLVANLIKLFFFVNEEFLHFLLLS